MKYINFYRDRDKQSQVSRAHESYNVALLWAKEPGWQGFHLAPQPVASSTSIVTSISTTTAI